MSIWGDYGGFIEVTDNMLSNYPSYPFYPNEMVTSGRAAVKQLLQIMHSKQQITTLYVPALLCKSAIQMLPTNIGTKTYHLDKELCLETELKPKAHEAVLVVDFFGILPKFPFIGVENLIWDYTHSIYNFPFNRKPYSFASVRKWYGLPDGALITAKLKSNQNSRSNPHELVRHHSGLKKYEEYKLRELSYTYELIDYLDVSNWTQQIFPFLSHDKCRAARFNNCESYNIYFQNINEWNLEGSAPLYYHLKLNRDVTQIRHRLAKTYKIYCPILWEDTIGELNTAEREIVTNTLHLPCDFRYTSDDIHYIVSCVKNELKSQPSTI